MAESFVTLTALVASTSAIVLDVVSIASRSWLGGECNDNEEVFCSPSACCFTTATASEVCTSLPSFVNRLGDVGIDTEADDADMTVTILFAILAIFIGAIAWAYATRAVLSDSIDGLPTAAYVSFAHVLFLIIEMAVFVGSGIKDDVEDFVASGLFSGSSGCFEVGYRWGFWVLIGAIATQFLAGVLLKVGHSVAASAAK